MRWSRCWIGVVVAWLALWPGLGLAQSSTSFTFHAGATAVANGAVLSAANYSTIIVQVEGTFVGTVQFQKKTKSGSAYVAVQCTDANDRTMVSTTADSPGYWECPGAAYSFRAAVTAYTSGTIIVTGMGSTAVTSRGGTGSGGGASTLDQAFDGGKVIDGANSLANAVRIGDGTTPLCLYTDATLGPVIRPCTDANTRTYAWTNFTWCLYDVEGSTCMLTVDPDAASRNAMYQFAANYKPLGSIPVTLYPRGAASYSEASIVTNQEKGGWIQLTDADTDAVDFRFTVTGKVTGVTTATVRLYGVSDNAAPSGNIVLNCAMRSNRPGTDTYVAHSTTGEQAITLTPATQNRPVSAVTSAITINGTVAEFAEIEGSCEVNAASTTSAQLTDFFLRAEALVQLNVNSWSD